ncbi:PREDICTED: uncharacterized protein LOC104809586 [Tarenaya hassleriana]|uniref:uncharacterized protein LOC104809586 n=1 Tax=Tarenaya hassleriana TaxID=28532 RepID=UPI00053C8EA8|nr:PREDICTED: uncharacterized protein LOC104809586 [Tarenaya hassleriana]
MGGRAAFSPHLAAIAVAIVMTLAIATAEARRVNLCSHTAYPSLCGPLVRRLISPRRATHRLIRALEARTKTSLAEASRYKSGNQAIATCYATFVDALINLRNARKSIRKRNVKALNTFLTAAVSDYGACVDAFIESRQINNVQNAADTLRKMGSNCLSLSTLIRRR